MGNDEGTPDSVPALQFANMAGTPVTGRLKDKPERIREAMDDLQLAIDGLQVQLTPETQSGQFTRSVAALARACSVFLRKMVLGDRNNKATRLLDDDVCESMGLKFHKLVKVTGDRKPIDISFSLVGGYVNATKKNEETLLPEYTISIPIGPQKLNITVEWPLPGMSNWVDDPNDESAREMRVEELFDLVAEPTLSCSEWLSQQLVLFDSRGIALREVITTIVNTEGAHSVGGGRLRTRKNEKPQEFTRRQRLNILNNITFGSVKYNHIVVIESALYLYERMMQHRVAQGEAKGYYMPVICVIPDVLGSLSPANPRIMGFEGGLILGLGGLEQIVSMKIRATK